MNAPGYDSCPASRLRWFSARVSGQLMLARDNAATTRIAARWSARNQKLRAEAYLAEMTPTTIAAMPKTTKATYEAWKTTTKSAAIRAQNIEITLGLDGAAPSALGTAAEVAL